LFEVRLPIDDVDERVAGRSVAVDDDPCASRVRVLAEVLDGLGFVRGDRVEPDVGG
jgi:hypothetical protein